MTKRKVALVTGASSGVGEAIAEALAREGYNLVLAARRLEVLQENATRYERDYAVQAVPVRTDLTLYQDIKRLIETTRSKFGGLLDVLINVAGEFVSLPFVGTEPQDFVNRYNRAIALMQNAAVYTSVLALDMLLERKGIIVSISSNVGLERNVYPNQLPYLGAKAAINHMTRGMDLELRGKGCRAFAIAPGNIDTPLLRRAVESDKGVKRIVIKKFGGLEEFYSQILKPKDIAEKLLGIIQNPDNYQDAVVEMPSVEF